MIPPDRNRPPIPAEIARRVLIEAGHRCAIPTCRYIEVEIHHIVPWADGKTHRYDNLIALCANCHRRADRGEIDRKSLRIYKINLRFAHDKYSQLEMDVLFDLYKLPHNHGLPWLAFQLIFLKRLWDSEFIEMHENPTGSMIGNLKTTPDTIAITDKGRAFIEDLGVEQL
jgi:hypothetical protein